MPEDEQEPKKRIGRPAKNPALGKRINAMFRINEATRDRLMSAADMAGRSMSEEIERRIDRSFEDVDLLLSYFGSKETLKMAQAIATISRIIENNTGKSWNNDPEAKAHFTNALRRFSEIVVYEQDVLPAPPVLLPLGGSMMLGHSAAEAAAEAVGLRSKAREEMNAFLATPEGKAAFERASASIKSNSQNN